MIADASPDLGSEARQVEYFREVLRDIRRVMASEYGLHRVSIRPIGSDGSRLSMPVKILGTNSAGNRVRLFGKILGNNDAVSDRSMQFVKNLYLEISALDPIFDFTDTAEDMARQQFESLTAIYKSGIPTPKPFGYHRINEGTWLVVAEFLRAQPISQWKECTPDQIDTLFGYLRTLHDGGLFHGDLKPENIMLGDCIYILDTGVLREDVDTSKKQAYDLACLVGTCLERCRPEIVVSYARRYYTRQDLLEAMGYVDLVQQRQDFHFSTEQEDELKRLLKDPPPPAKRAS
jgi:tRNA A-37 threonylcarbamoyl transferase component Bud32